MVFLLLRSGKRRTLNLQNRQYSPKFAIYGYKDDKSQQLRYVFVYFEEKYQHYPRYFTLNTKLVIFPYKSFKFQTDCLVPLWLLNSQRIMLENPGLHTAVKSAVILAEFRTEGFAFILKALRTFGKREESHF